MTALGWNARQAGRLCTQVASVTTFPCSRYRPPKSLEHVFYKAVDAGSLSRLKKGSSVPLDQVWDRPFADDKGAARSHQR